MNSRYRRAAQNALIIVALFAASVITARVAMRDYRAAGVEPSFYQTNFEPAVMMACGRGFGASPLPSPELDDFLRTRRDALECGLLPAGSSRPLTTTANANWYYLYGTVAAIWRLTGVSWTALDILVAAFCGGVTLLLYGLFRLIAGRIVAASISLLLTISPANLIHLLSLRDYSKVPFVLAAILVLAVLVVRPMSRAWTLALAAVYGAVVGVGYGFRGDLAVMVPFGAVVALLLLPGSLGANIARNGVAAAVLLAVFLVVAGPVIAGLKTSGGCQYHFALLGLTTPNTTELHLRPPLYRFGDHSLDIFGSLKIGDYGSRILHQPLAGLCDAQFDAASGQLFMRMLRMFPADFAVRAYGSVLMILRLSFVIPEAKPGLAPFPSSVRMASLYGTLDAMTSPLGRLGVFVALAAIAMAWASSVRLGVALTVFVLFLTGYPAIRFEERHWYHLRFIPWWAAAMVAGQIRHRGPRPWGRPVLRAAIGVVGLFVVLAVVLAALRVVQQHSVRTLIAQYLVAPTEEMPVRHEDGAMLSVRWQPRDYGRAPEHRGSDLVVVTLDASHCSGTGPVTLTARYDVDTQDGGHDLSTAFTLARPEVGAEPTRVFIPVFWAGTSDHTFLRFSGFEVAAAPTTCVGHVARVIDPESLPLWLEMLVPPDWSERRLYQAIDPPGFLKSFLQRPL